MWKPSLFFKISSFIILVLFFLSAGYFFISGRVEEKNVLKQYEDSQKSFKMLYPSDWKIEKLGKTPFFLSFTNPVADISGNIFNSARMMLAYKESPVSPLDLDNFKDIIKSDIAKTLIDFQIIKEEKQVINGRESYIIESIDKGDDKSNPVLYHSMFFVTVSDKAEYLVWASSLDSKWESYKDMFNSCIESFAID